MHALREERENQVVDIKGLQLLFFYVYSNRVSSFLFCIKDSFTDAALLQRFGFRLPGKQLVCKAEM